MNNTTIGIIGGGQLGRMLALAAYPLGVRVRVLEPANDPPAGHVAEWIQCAYDDPGGLQQLAAGAAVATYEFENVPRAAVEYLVQHCPVFPPAQALVTAQDRVFEKTCFQRLAIPTAPFLAIDSYTDLVAGLEQLGLPALLKTRRMGYDGKGQFLIRSAADLEAAWHALGAVPLILEGFVRFERELALLAVRSSTGETCCYPLVENQHCNGILHTSRAPAQVSASLQAHADQYAARLLAELEYVGVLAIELFQIGDQLLANEIAPRVHNSGHWTIEGAVTSQFENHVRAVLGLPLGDTSAIGHSVMINLVGRLPDTHALLAIPGAHLHLYGKAARPGRKLGHVTVCADNEAILQERYNQAIAIIDQS